MAKKHTKKALFTSVMSLVLCFAMLVGTTFAWFTDSAVSGMNEITAGNLDVELLRNGNETVTAETELFGNIDLWEPGVVAYESLAVENAGTLAMKYNLSINYEDQNNLNGHKLSDVLQVAVVSENVAGMTREAVLDLAKASNNKGSLTTFSMEGELLGGQKSDPRTVVIFWEPSTDEVDNLYNVKNGNKTSDEQPLHISFGVRVYATQLAHENDSFGPDYDASTAVNVTTAGELIAALAQGGSVSLAKDIEVVDDSIVIPAGVSAALNLNGHTITGANTSDVGAILKNVGALTLIGGKLENTAVNGAAVVENTGSLTMDGVAIQGAPIDSTGYSEYAVSTSGALIVEGETVINSDRGAIRMNDGADVVINDGTFVVSNAADGRNMTLHVIYAKGANSKLTIKGGHFEQNHTSTGGASVICPAGATIDIYGGDFCDAMDDNTWTSTGNFQNYMGYTAPVNVYGGTFDDETVKKHVSEGFVATESSGTWSVGIDTAKVEDVFTKAENGDTINLAAGINVIPDSAQGKTLTIMGSENGETIIATQDDGSYEGCDYSLQGATVTFENITINTDSSTYTGYAGLNATYKNCTINGSYTLYGNSVFENCTFNVSGDNYNIWTWGAPTATFIDCTFNTSGKSVLLYGGADTVLTVTNCVFNDANDYEDVNNKAAIEVGSDWDTDKKQIIATNCTVNGFDITNKGIYTGSTLWGNKSSLDETRLSVKVDGVDVRKTVYINSAEALVNFADDVNKNGKNFNGKTVVLTNDIDLAGIDWEPIGQTGATQFVGTFDGQNHTIYNLTVDSSAETGENYSSGLFGWVEGKVVIKNVKIDGASVIGNHNVSALIGYTYSAQVSNCQVTNSQIICKHANDDACGDKCGLIAGYAGDESRFTTCSASNSTVTAGRDAGQLIGCGYNKSVNNCSATNVTIINGGDCTGANVNASVIGRVMG